jgi:hypothetical protein
METMGVQPLQLVFVPSKNFADQTLLHPFGCTSSTIDASPMSQMTYQSTRTTGRASSPSAKPSWGSNLG